MTEGCTCSTSTHPPCSFCETATEDETEAYFDKLTRDAFKGKLDRILIKEAKSSTIGCSISTSPGMSGPYLIMYLVDSKGTMVPGLACKIPLSFRSIQTRDLECFLDELIGKVRIFKTFISEWHKEDCLCSNGIRTSLFEV